MRFRSAPFLLGLLAVATPAQTAACSVVESYKVPTALELVSQADGIVLARVGGPISGEDKDDLHMLELTPEALVAGTILPDRLQIDGYHGDGRQVARPSDPYELEDANPDAFTGACNRYIFSRGMLLLLFLDQRQDGSWGIINAPFARTLEDVPDANALWVRAVRFYATVADLPRQERNAAMEEERNRLLSTGDRQDALLAADIRRQTRRKRTQNFD